MMSNGKQPVCKRCGKPSQWVTDTEHGYLCDGCRYRAGLLGYFAYIQSQLRESELNRIGDEWRAKKEAERKKRYRAYLDRYYKDPEHQDRIDMVRRLQKLL